MCLQVARRRTIMSDASFSFFSIFVLFGVVTFVSVEHGLCGFCCCQSLHLPRYMPGARRRALRYDGGGGVVERQKMGCN